MRRGVCCRSFKADPDLMELPMPSINFTVGEIQCIMETADDFGLQAKLFGTVCHLVFLFVTCKFGLQKLHVCQANVTYKQYNPVCQTAAFVTIDWGCIWQANMSTIIMSDARQQLWSTSISGEQPTAAGDKKASKLHNLIIQDGDRVQDLIFISNNLSDMYFVYREQCFDSVCV